MSNVSYTGNIVLQPDKVRRMSRGFGQLDDDLVTNL
jgi:hypothetical protein